MLNLMYITKRPEIARIAEEAGVDWIFVDMEFIGKDCRQGGLDTVQNHHSVKDVANIKAAVRKAKVLVRVNPIHESLAEYPACPLYWKLFFWSAKNEQVWLFYIMTKAMRKILERRKK